MTRRSVWIFGLVAGGAVATSVCWGLLMYRHVDRAADFAFDGTVTTAGGSPVADADIVFVDTGFDESATTRNIERVAGKTDADGRMAAKLSYRYGLSYVFARPTPKQTFRLIIRKNGMADVARDYQATSLPVDAGAFVLRFEIVLPGSAT